MRNSSTIFIHWRAALVGKQHVGYQIRIKKCPGVPFLIHFFFNGKIEESIQIRIIGNFYEIKNSKLREPECFTL